MYAWNIQGNAESESSISEVFVVCRKKKFKVEGSKFAV